MYRVIKYKKYSFNVMAQSANIREILLRTTALKVCISAFEQESYLKFRDQILNFCIISLLNFQ